MSMFRQSGRQWFRELHHPSDEDVLLYLDGELGSKEAEHFRKHAEACWSCRARTEKMKQVIVGFVEYRNATCGATASQLPPNGWREFEGRLQQLASQTSKPSVLAYCVSLLRPPVKQAGLAVLTLTLLLIWYQHSVSIVSAHEFLHHAQQAELTEVGSVASPVVYQKLQVRRWSTETGSKAPVTLEIWHDETEARLVQRSDDTTWSELEDIFQANGMSGKRPLAPSAYESWRRSIHKKNERVVETTLPDGVRALSLETVSEDTHHRPGRILEAKLVVRSADWHPVRQSLRVQQESEVQEYEITEFAFNVVTLSAVAPLIFRESQPAPALRSEASIQRNPSSALMLPPAVDPAPLAAVAGLDITETEAHYALHLAKACLGEPIHVTREDHQVVVRGLAATNQRRDELMAALSDLPLVKVEIESLEEVSATQFPPVPEPADGAQTPVIVRIEKPLASIQGRLQRYFTERESPASATSSLAALSNEAVSLSESCLSEAWALRRLSQWYPEDKVKELRTSSRWLLQAMVRDHVAGLHEKLLRSRGLLEPILTTLRPSVEAPVSPDFMESARLEGVLGLFSRVQRMERLIKTLFASAQPPEADSDEADVALLTALVELEKQLQVAETEDWARFLMHSGNGDGGGEVVDAR